MSESAVDQVRHDFQRHILPESDPRVRQVQKVLDRLLPYAEGEGLEKLTWEVTVIESPEENAFVTPGGKVFVFTGILPLCKDEHGIAAVLATRLRMLSHITQLNACRMLPSSSLAPLPSPSLISPLRRANRLSTSFSPCLAPANTRAKQTT